MTELDSDELRLDVTPRQGALADLAAIQECLEAIEPGIKVIGQGLMLRPVDSPLPSNRLVSPVTYRGFMAVEQAAVQVDQIFPEGGFQEAVHAAWNEICSRMQQRVTKSRRNAILCGHILFDIEHEKADAPEGAFTEGGLAVRISKCDPELFATLTAVSLGRFLRDRKIGSVPPWRHITKGDKAKGEPDRVWHTVVIFTETDRTKLRMLSAGEEQNFIPPEDSPMDLCKRWVLDKFTSRPNVTVSDAERLSTEGKEPFGRVLIFQALEELTKSGVILKSDDSHYDFLAVAVKSGREE